MIYFAPETLDALAEQLLIADANARDEHGHKIGRQREISDAPGMVRRSLNSIYGIMGWQTISQWPRPEQLQPHKSIFDRMKEIENAP